MTDARWPIDRCEPVQDVARSQSEILAMLRGEAHTTRPYSLAQLLHDISRLTVTS